MSDTPFDQTAIPPTGKDAARDGQPAQGQGAHGQTAQGQTAQGGQTPRATQPAQTPRTGQAAQSGQPARTAKTTQAPGQSTSQATGQGAKATADTAKDEAKSVAQDASESGKAVASTAKDEAQQVVGEAKNHAQDLFHQARSEVSTQAATQQERVAGLLRSVSGELGDMGNNAQTGMASGLVNQAAGQLDQVAGWLENREPAELLEDVKRYARRNPGTFLAIAGLVGFVGGRVTRSLQAQAGDDNDHRSAYRALPVNSHQVGTQHVQSVAPAYGGGERTVAPQSGGPTAPAQPAAPRVSGTTGTTDLGREGRR